VSGNIWTRVRSGLAALAIAHVINVAGTVLLVPLYLARWSPSVYGEWLTLFSLAAYVVTLDFGMNAAVVNRLTQAYARKDLHEYRRVADSALVYYLVLGASALLALVLAARFLPFASWVGLRAIRGDDAFWVLVLLGLPVVVSLPTGLIVGIYRTSGHFARGQWVFNLTRAAQYSLTGLGLLIGGGLKLVAVLQCLPVLAVLPFVIADVRCKFPQLLPGLGEASWTAVRGLLQPSFFFFVMIVALSLTQQGPVLLISAMLGGVAVAVFVTSRTLANLVRQVVGAVASALWPDMTSLEVRGEYAKLRVAHRVLVVVSNCLCIAVAAAFWFDGAEVIRIWTHGRLQPDTFLLRMLLLQLVLQSPWLACSAVISAANAHRRLSGLYIASSVLGLILAALLMKRFGLSAVPVGFMLAEGLACYHFVARESCKVVQERYRSFAFSVWSGVVLVGATTFVAAYVAHRFEWGAAPVRWAETGMVCLAVSALVSWYVCLPREMRPMLARKLRPATGAQTIATVPQTVTIDNV
jgi:O-antigen/teichoic acid export membrane protein